MDHRSLGLFLVGLGGLIALVGLGVYLRLLVWFGRLPGDIRLEGEHGRLYFPITSMLIVSVALSLVLWALRKMAS